MTTNDLIKYWPIFAVALSGAVAWGAQQMEIKSIRDVQVQQQQNINTLHALGAKQARIDERTKAIKENQQRQEILLQDILRKLQ